MVRASPTAQRAGTVDGLWDHMAVLRRFVMAQMQPGIAATPGLDLTLPQSTAVLMIAERGAMSVSELQALLSRSQSTTSYLVTQLELKGLVERRSEARDARRSIIHLTKAGAALVKRIELVRRRGFEQVMRAVPAPVIAQLEAAMRALVAALEGRGGAR